MKRLFTKCTYLMLGVALASILMTGCKKQDTIHGNHDQHEDSNEDSKMLNTDEEFKRQYSKLNFITVLELLEARWASAKYRNIENAIHDGYHDINVVVENMGHHFMRDALVDNKFDPRKPEILVYNKHENGHYELVAVEYAVPLDLSPNKAPKGFSGSADVWDHNDGFGLWLLHAWVWSKNPDGVFHPTNPTVHTH